MADLSPADRRLLARCERIVRLAAHLVPGAIRADWAAEWSSELFYRIDRLSTGAPAGRIARRLMLTRAAGAVPHALWLQLQQWRFNAQDVRFGLRTLARQPFFALVVVATLALGIGANTAMFTLVDAVLLRPLPYRDPGQLVWAFGSFPGNRGAPVSPPDFDDYRQRNHSFSSMGAMMLGRQSIAIDAGAGSERVAAAVVSDHLLETLGIRPVAGRLFRTDEARAGAARTALISYRFWCDRFDCDPRAVGRTLDVDAEPTVILGVLPEGFSLPFDSRVGRTNDVRVWLPLRLGDPETTVRRFHFLAVIARLEPGVSLSAAQADVDAVARQLADVYPEDATWTLRLVPLREQIVGRVRPSLIMLQIVVGLVMLVACGNVASLVLARASTRAAEIAVRRALGASHGRVVRQLLTETAILALGGAAVALLLAWWSLDLIRASAPVSIPRLAEMRVDARVFIFTLGAVVLTTLVCGLAPALHAVRADVMSSLKGAGRSSDGRSPRRLRSTLVAAQVAASAVLLTAAGLLMRSLWNLQAVAPGFDSSHVVTTELWLPEQRYGTDVSRRRAIDTLVDRLVATPGVEAAAVTNVLPMSGANDTMVYPEGQPPATAADRRYAQIRTVSPRYFDTMRIPLIAGRSLSARDGPDSPAVVVVNQTMAREYFGESDPVGRRLVIDLRMPLTAEIVGVVGDVRDFGPSEQPPPVFYFPTARLTPPVLTLVVRSGLDLSAMVPALRAAVREIDRTLPLGRVESMDAVVARTVAQPRFRSMLLAGFAALALLLTVVGLYGALAYLVSLRARDIGIRLALGASAGTVMQIVMRHGALLVAAGLLVGSLLSLWATRLLSGLLFMVGPRDPLVLAAVVASVGLCGLAAAAIPAWRAARVDPLLALRREE